MKLQRNGMPMCEPETLAVGDIVKVNCYRARIERVIGSLRSEDRFRGYEQQVSLLNPVYEVCLDFSKKYNWNEKRVYIPQGCKRLKLFQDEFEIVRRESERVAA